MRSIVFFFVLSLLLYGVFIYLLDNLPFIDASKLAILEEQYGIITQTELINYLSDIRSVGLISEIWIRNNFLVMLSVTTLMIFSTLATIHLFIDKLFFKTIFEKPNLSKALRRSSLLSLAIIGLGLLKVWGVFLWYTWGLLLILVIGIETLFSLSERDQKIKIEEIAKNESDK